MFNKNLFFGITAFFLFPILSAAKTDSIAAMNDGSTIYFKLGYQSIFNVDLTIKDAFSASITPDKYIKYIATINSSTDVYNPNYLIDFFGGSIAIGKEFGDSSAEFEISSSANLELNNSEKYFNNTSDLAAFKNGGSQISVALFNVYTDINLNNKNLVPYVGAGVGFGRVNFMSIADTSVITYPFALQFKTGFKIKVNDMFNFYVGYKLQHLLETESGEINSEQPTMSPARNKLDIVEYLPNNTPTMKIYPKSASTSHVQTKIKSTYTLHDFDFGVMVVIK